MTLFWDFGSQNPADLETRIQLIWKYTVFKTGYLSELRLPTQSTSFSHVGMFPWAENKVPCSKTQRCINGEIPTTTSWLIYMVKSFINAKLHSEVICLSIGLSLCLLSNFVYASGLFDLILYVPSTILQL